MLIKVTPSMLLVTSLFIFDQDTCMGYFFYDLGLNYLQFYKFFVYCYVQSSSIRGQSFRKGLFSNESEKLFFIPWKYSKKKKRKKGNIIVHENAVKQKTFT